MEAWGGVGRQMSLCVPVSRARIRNWNTSLSTHSSHSIVLCIQLYCNTAITSIAFECFIHIYQTFRSRWKTLKKTPIKVVFFLFLREDAERVWLNTPITATVYETRTHTYTYIFAGWWTSAQADKTRNENKNWWDDLYNIAVMFWKCTFSVIHI